MIEQWQELKETIIELRDNNGTCTQQEVCQFLATYMKILEKQIDYSDYISRQAAIEGLGDCPTNWTDSDAEIMAQSNWEDTVKMLKSLPPVTPQQKIEQ